MPHVLVALVALVVVFASSPIAAAPCAGFTDVEDTSPFCPNVTWLNDRAITLGCAAGLYCPNDFVSRLQMAAFMNRLGNALFPLTCSPGQIMKWDGLAWVCANDIIGGSGGGGTVTSISAGPGLVGAPNPITGVGTLSLAPGYHLPQSCSAGQIPKSNGSGGWTCAADNDTNSGGTVTSLTAGTGITLTPSPITSAGSIAVNTTTIQARVTGTCAAGSSIRAIDAAGAVTCETDDAGPANAFVHNGNAFGGTAVLGTTDNQALEVRVNNARVMRYEPNAISPNVIGGHPANGVAPGVRGATIGGGGVALGDSDPDYPEERPNTVTGLYGTIGGGYGNVAGDFSGSPLNAPFATVAGGFNNTAGATASTVAGGLRNNAAGDVSAVAGGSMNAATGPGSSVAGGLQNQASGLNSFVAGGERNQASAQNSFAAGTTASANFPGCFVWGDVNFVDAVRCNGLNRFVVRARGGIFMWAGGTTQATYFGVELDPGATAWTVSSDRRLKENLRIVDTRDVLERVLALPISTWNLKSQDPSIRHMGAMAQDFRAAFGLGKNDVGINTIDADGVALAAIQGLDAKLEAQIAERDRRIADLTREVVELRRTVELLVARLGGGSPSLAAR